MNTFLQPLVKTVAAIVMLGGAFVAPAAQAQFIAPYGTGFNGAGGLQYNSMQGATMSVMLQGMQQQSMMRSSLMSSYYAYGAYGQRRRGLSPAQKQAARGRALIKSGRATLSFVMRTPPSVQWVDEWAKTNPQGRAGALAEWRAQSAIWRQEVAARGAKYGRMDDMMGLALVSCVEGYSGQRVNNAGFRAVANSFKRVWSKDPDFQGYTRVEKQQKYEDAMLAGSWALYLRRKGDPESLRKARESANKFLDTYWKTDRKNTSNADGAVIFLARFSGKVAPKNAPRMAAAPAVRVAKVAAPATPRNPTRVVAADVESEDGEETAPSAAEKTAALASARRITSYAPQADALLPSMMAQGAKPEERAETLRLIESLLKQGRANLRQINGRGADREDVAQAFSFALMTFVAVHKSPKGDVTQAGWTNANVQGLTDQLTFVLGNDPKFKRQDARQKQMMFEGAILMAALTGAFNGEAERAGNPELRQAALKTASSAMRTLFGVSPEQVRLTATGVQF